MAATLVLVFIADYLPGDILNRTLENTLQLSENDGTRVFSCDHRIADPLLLEISHNIGVEAVPAWDREADNEFTKNAKVMKDTSIEIQQNIEKVLEHLAAEKMNSLEQTRFIDDNFINREMFDGDSDCEKQIVINETVLSKNVNNETDEVIFPKMAPVLVAIFESLEDVTAQTCGGTVLAPEWVITAASCIGLLHKLYHNGTSHEMDKSEYTVIANSTNPFIEGSVHNVTQIYLHPGKKLSSEGRLKNPKWKMVSPTLAMMRVQPAVAGAPVYTLTMAVGLNMDVMLYGWLLRKNDTHHESIQQIRAAARTVPPRECTVSNVSISVVCLSFAYNKTGHSEEDHTEIWMSPGGPVLTLQQGEAQLLGVAAAAEHGVPTAVFPLAPHALWMHRIMENTLDNSYTVVLLFATAR